MKEIDSLQSNTEIVMDKFGFPNDYKNMIMKSIEKAKSARHSDCYSSFFENEIVDFQYSFACILMIVNTHTSQGKSGEMIVTILITYKNKEDVLVSQSFGSYN